MIKHIVSWKIKDFAEGNTKVENLKIMKHLLLNLKEKIPVIKDIEVGINSSNTNESNFDIVLISKFGSLQDLNAYQTHPEHVKVADFVGKIRETRACIDFEI